MKVDWQAMAGFLLVMIRDIFVALAALGGAFLWQISPETNLVTAFVFGIIGTAGYAVFGRDAPLEDTSDQKIG